MDRSRELVMGEHNHALFVLDQVQRTRTSSLDRLRITRGRITVRSLPDPGCREHEPVKAARDLIVAAIDQVLANPLDEDPFASARVAVSALGERLTDD